LQALVSLLPRVFVGSYDRLQQLVGWVCREMQASFQGSGGGLPPWRSLEHVLNKWRLHGDDDALGSSQQQEGQEQDQEQKQLAAQQQQEQQEQLSWQQQPGASAFSVEQQETMRTLLGGQLPVPVPQQPSLQAALPSSSSCSSMDTGGGPAGAGSLTPRSLLTQELSELAAASAADCTQQQGKRRGPPAPMQPMGQRRWA
jgi:hypothetical protein